MADNFKIKSNGQFEPFKWKNIQDNAKKICWQKGMIRLFADGTNDWTKKNRINLNIEGFNCLNYQDSAHFNRPLQVNRNNFNRDYGSICISPGVEGDGNELGGSYGAGGCIQVPLPQPDNLNIKFPWELSLKPAKVSTVPDEKPAGIVVQWKTLSYRVPYIPRPFLNSVPISQDEPAPSYFINQFSSAQSVYLPIYIGGLDNIVEVTTSYFDQNEVVAENVPAKRVENCSISKNPKIDLNENEWCIQNSDYTGFYDVLHIRGAKNPLGKEHWGYGGFTITFNSLQSKDYIYQAGDPLNFPEDKNKTLGMGGGNSLYYLTMLGRLELLGIPEIFYEPIYCNSNREKLVPDIFNLKEESRTEFEKPENSKPFREISDVPKPQYLYGWPEYPSSIDFANPKGLITYSNKISHPDIFSKNSFRCCLYLGKETSDSSQCCSNFSALDANGKRICKLPTSADLSVYFNRYVSDDGVGMDLPGGGLKEEDFIPETGEPKLTKEVTDKIRVLGQTYCVSGNVRYGGAFGYFIAQPNNGYFTQTPNPEDNTFYSIIDSALDYQGDPGDTLSGSGTIRFLEGYRWNHHLYCGP